MGIETVGILESIEINTRDTNDKVCYLTTEVDALKAKIVFLHAALNDSGVLTYDGPEIMANIAKKKEAAEESTREPKRTKAAKAKAPEKIEEPNDVPVDVPVELPEPELEEYDPLSEQIPIDASITLEALTAKCKAMREAADDKLAFNDTFVRILKNTFGVDRLSALPKTEYKSFLALIEMEI